MPTAAVIAVVGVALAAWGAVADQAAGMSWAATALDCAVGLAFVAAAAGSGRRPLPMLSLASVGFAWLVASPVDAATIVHRGLLVLALLLWWAPRRPSGRRQAVLGVVALAAAVGVGWQLGAAALLIAAAGVRYRRRLAALLGSDGPPRVDDDAIRQILEKGSLRGPAVDMRAAASAEEEFWSETWDEPEEYRP